MIAFVVVTSGHLLWNETVGSSVTSFAVLMAATMVAFAFCTANFGTLAMSNMAPIAGTASSTQGTVSTVLAALIGAAIGQAYDGTLTPYLAGLAIVGIAALGIVTVTEGGKLFKRQSSGAAATAPLRATDESELCE